MTQPITTTELAAELAAELPLLATAERIAVLTVLLEAAPPLTRDTFRSIMAILLHNRQTSDREPATCEHTRHEMMQAAARGRCPLCRED